MKLQYVSDLHLELVKSKNVPTIKPIDNNTYLALCGDIGNPFMDTYTQFLDIHTKLYKHILIVSGNHEYYSSKSKQYTMSVINDKITQIANNYNNVTYLNMGKIIINRTKFIGCTLWSDISSVSSIVEDIMNDYKNIYTDNPGTPSRKIVKTEGLRTNKRNIKADRSPLHSYDVINMHTQMKKWLFFEISKDNNNNKYENIVVLTHHAPTLKMLDRSDLYSPCYGTNLESMMINPVKYWISGHTHVSKKVVINNTTCLSNCWGYPQQKGTGYDANAYIEI